ncbi:MAG TPA: sodium:proton antiporter [Ktedonobacterales bacterium]|jgi:CPA1 family monovalent cation:H+ antiporter
MQAVPAVRLVVVLMLVALATIVVTRRLRVPYSLGLVVVGLAIAAFRLLPDVRLTPDVVLDVFLPALLFEGAWTLDIHLLRRVWLPVTLLVGPGLLLTVGICAVVLRLGAGLDWGAALLLGAILAPTDPVAVLALFRELGVGDRLRTTIEGESLFNDGVASVVYLVVLGLVVGAEQGQAVTAAAITGAVALGVVRLVLAGTALGSGAGLLVAWGLRRVDEPLLETTMTLVAAYGVYLLADALGFSGILAVVCLGLVLGNYGKRVGMSERTQEAADGFWSQVAFLANALLFLLVGAQIDLGMYLYEPGAGTLLAAAGWAIAAVLGGRAFAVYALRPVARLLRLPAHASWPPVLLWAGLRGALSMALALALPYSLPTRSTLVAATYAVVLFTLLVQGLSLREVLRRLGVGHHGASGGRARE